MTLLFPISNDDLAATVGRSVSSGKRVDILPYEPIRESIPDNINEYCFFLKPELATLTGAALDSAIGIVIDGLSRVDQTLVGVSVLPGRYLERHDIMAKHYSVINRASVNGFFALSEEGQARAAQMLGVDEASSLDVLGGEQFIKQFDYFTPHALCALHDSLPSVKLDAGAYGVRVVVDGRSMVLINGFHPLQLDWFYRPIGAIVVMVFRGEFSWKTMRQEVVGATNPSAASASTIRGRLLLAATELGFPVSALRNGVHASAGPLEGAVEIARYMSPLDTSQRMPIDSTTFGAQLARVLGSAEAERLASNPPIAVSGESAASFDATEEMDAADVLRLLAAVEVSHQ